MRPDWRLLPHLLDQFAVDRRRADRMRFLQAAAPFFNEQWHWFQYHFSRIPPTPFGQSLVDACIRLEQIETGRGLAHLKEIARIGGREKEMRDYDQILQKMAELLVINAVADMEWPALPGIRVEEQAPGSRKGVDCVVTLPEHRYGFEIKAPALLGHRENRAANSLQLPGRYMPRDVMEMHVDQVGGKVTLPRDNPVHDFLASANEKFRAFKAQGPFTGILVIVWDDFIYEPITSLVHERCGLLTPNTYKNTADGQPVTYPSVDAVVLLRHLTYFTTAAAEQPLIDGRKHAFHLGGESALPNVVIPVREDVPIPTCILDGLWAWPLTDPWLQHAGDYHPSDFVWWHDAVPAGPSRLV
jgi:hypothetical protein